MSLSDKDRELWRMAMKDVKPFYHDHVAPVSLPVFAAKLPPPQRHTWDLHGMTVRQAHELTLQQINQLQHTYRFATFITGKSGQMNQEFRHWLEGNPHVRNIEVSNDGGAYRVWFKKTRHKRT